MMPVEMVIQSVAGGIAGTTGAIATSPLEVVKTRLQSSTSNFDTLHIPSIAANNQTGQVTCRAVPQSKLRRFMFSTSCHPGHSQFYAMSADELMQKRTSSLYRCLRFIIETEGPKALFKGLGPNLVGVAPSRAIYFASYSSTKKFCNSHLSPDTPLVHILSAACAGFTSCTLTNPIWFVKTRLQLDQRVGRRYSALECVRYVYRKHGLTGFYKGITASYYGISETVIHFVIYEYIKARLAEFKMSRGEVLSEKSFWDFSEFMMAGATSKAIATCCAYPHEVVRTRLREEGDKYRSFWQTLLTVWKEEGRKGLYRGLTTQLIRQIPNTAIIMSTYEACVYLMTKYMLPEATSDFYVYEEEEEE